MEEFLASLGIKADQLNPVEQETYNAMLRDMSIKEFTVDDIRDYLTRMRESIEMELTDNPNNISMKQDIMMKARLKNYMLLLAFMDSPRRAKEALERQLKNIKKQ